MRETCLKAITSLIFFPISFAIFAVIMLMATALWVLCFFVKLYERIVQIFIREYESDTYINIVNVIMEAYAFGFICLIAPLSLFDFFDD